jgi:lysophospholipase L1-like esterase
MHNLFCFGDSICFGEGDSQTGGWVEQLKKRLKDTTVFNLGVPGETTDGLRLRFEPEVKPRIFRSSKTTIILNYGANDIVVHNKSINAESGLKKEKETTGETQLKQQAENSQLKSGGQQNAPKLVVPIAFFEKNIIEALNYACAINAEVILLSLLPVHSLDDGVNNGFEQVKYDASVIAYNEKLRQIAKQFNATFIDLYSGFMSGSDQQTGDENHRHMDDGELQLTQGSLFCPDRVHPNTRGHCFIADKVERLVRQSVGHL